MLGLRTYNSRMTDKDAPDDACDKGGSAPLAADLLKPIRQIVIFVLGMSVVIVGIAMIVLPGPATIVIPAGLAILATEFVWARRWLNYLKRRAQDAMDWTANSIGASNGSCKNEDESSTASRQ